MNSMIGQQLGKVRVDALIGEGAMGAVFRGHHLALDVPVAVKVIRPESGEDPELVERFLQEARLAARLRHPNVVKVYDVGQDRGRSYIVMELLEGVTLDRALPRGRAHDPQRLLTVFRTLAEALGEAHQKGIVHRDVKPQNIIVVGDRPVLTDFGIAAMRLSGTRLTRPGHVVGTPVYMAPEQARGEERPRAESDVFALCLVFYEILAGAIPDETDNLAALFQSRARAEFPRLEQIRPEVPRALAQLLARGLARDPRARFANGTELAVALADLERQGQRPRAAEASRPGASDPRPAPTERRLILPREEADVLVDLQPLGDLELDRVLGSLEHSPTGFAVLAAHLPGGEVAFLPITRGAATLGFVWREDDGQPQEPEALIARLGRSGRCVIEAMFVSEGYHDALLATLAARPEISGLRTPFADLSRLMAWLAKNRRSGVIRVELTGKLGLIELRQGVPIRLLASGIVQEPTLKQSLARLLAILGSRVDARLDVFAAEARDEALLALGRAARPVLELEGARELAALVAEVLDETSTLIIKLLGPEAGARLAEGTLAVAGRHPRFFQGLVIDPERGPKPEAFVSRVEQLPRTGRRGTVLASTEALITDRLTRAGELLGGGRRARKLVELGAEIWQHHRPRLEEHGVADGFAPAFLRLAEDPP